MTLRQLYQTLLPLVMQQPAQEMCGLLFGPPVPIATTVTSLEVTGVMPVKNVAATPHSRFEMDLETVRRLWRARKGEVLGFYHSHPSPPAIASDHDRWMVESTGLVSVILSPAVEMRIYGRHHGQMIEIASWQPRLTELVTHEASID